MGCRFLDVNVLVREALDDYCKSWGLPFGGACRVREADFLAAAATHLRLAKDFLVPSRRHMRSLTVSLRDAESIPSTHVHYLLPTLEAHHEERCSAKGVVLSSCERPHAVARCVHCGGRVATWRRSTFLRHSIAIHTPKIVAGFFLFLPRPNQKMCESRCRGHVPAFPLPRGTMSKRCSKAT